MESDVPEPKLLAILSILELSRHLTASNNLDIPRDHAIRAKICLIVGTVPVPIRVCPCFLED
jgi:hypothetical protein